MKTLSDVCEVYSGYALKEFNEYGDGLPVIKIGNIMADGSLVLDNCQYTSEIVNAKYLSQKGDIYVALSGATTGKIGILETDDTHVINQRVGIVRRTDDTVPYEYIKYFLLRQTERILKEAAGCAQPNISPKQIAAYEIPDISKAKMLEESTILDSISYLITQRKVELQRLDELIKARFVEVISQSNSIDIKLKDVVETDRIITYGMVKPGKDVEGGVIIIKVKDFPNGIIQTNDFLHSDPELESKYARSRVKAGDLLYSIRGTVGRTAFVTPELEGANITQDTARLSIDTKRFNPNYIRFALGYDEVVRTVESQIKGVAMKGISLSELREIEIPCVDYDAQQVFGEFVEQVDKSKSVVQKSLDEAQLLFDSLMQKYFG